MLTQICEPNCCTGCGLCEQICNHSAIRLQADAEGFLRPLINFNACAECGLCRVRCPANAAFQPEATSNKLALFVPKIYSGWSNDEKIRKASSSGGAFTEIAKVVIHGGGVVFGVALDDNITAHHICVETLNDLKKLRGSKYVQSCIDSAYKQVKENLLFGRKVLFSGTPCQIAGLYSFLSKDYPNLITVDIICHGVPSPMVFEDYKNYVAEIIKKPVSSVNFRWKKSSWIFFNIGINPYIEKKEIKYSYVGNYYSDPFIRAFLRDNILRPCCYNCKYTSFKRLGDFTIADWWGYKAVDKSDKGFEKKGVSLVMCNSRKAALIFKELKMTLRERTIEEAMATNLALSKPFARPETRDEFWSDYSKMPFREIVAKWMKPEKIKLSLYLKIYMKSKLLSKMIHLCERILHKMNLDDMIIYVTAK